jgi:exoribonuclease R
MATKQSSLKQRVDNLEMENKLLKEMVFALLAYQTRLSYSGVISLLNKGSELGYSAGQSVMKILNKREMIRKRK